MCHEQQNQTITSDLLNFWVFLSEYFDACPFALFFFWGGGPNILMSCPFALDCVLIADSSDAAYSSKHMTALGAYSNESFIISEINQQKIELHPDPPSANKMNNRYSPQ